LTGFNQLARVHEDLHWADPSTLELIQLLVEQGNTVPLFLLFTARPEFSFPMAAAVASRPDQLEPAQRPRLSGRSSLRSPPKRPSPTKLSQQSSTVPAAS
jgi:hypothetical protein